MKDFTIESYRICINFLDFRHNRKFYNTVILIGRLKIRLLVITFMKFQLYPRVNTKNFQFKT